MTETDYVILSILGLWVLYHLITTFIGKKKKGYLLIASLLFVGVYGYLLYDQEVKTMYLDIYLYVLLGCFSLNMFIGNLWKYFKKDISEYDFYALEEELEELKDTSELMRRRFISTIEILNDGISFRESDGIIFGSDKYIELVGLENNQFELENLYNLMHNDDIPSYRNAVEKTSKRNPIYNVDYRIKKDEKFIWIKEVGKRILIHKKLSYISIIKVLDIKQFPRTEIEVLDGLDGTKKMFKEMTNLNRKNQPYNFVYIKLTNIPQVNEKYGREVGNLMMGEYLKKLRYNFIKDNQSLYRINGIDFGLIIKDDKKYEILVRALQGSGELLNLKMVFGGITQILYPNIGISESPYEGKNPDIVYEEAKKALKISLEDKSNTNFCIFDKI